MNFHKKEVQILKSEKDTLESVLSMKTQDVKKTLGKEILKLLQDFSSRSSVDTVSHFLPIGRLSRALLLVRVALP